MSTTVIREVSAGVWTFSRPFARFGLVPVGGRSTAIQLRAGGVWVLASTPLEPATRAQLDTLGPVQYIVGADAGHHLYLAEYARAYPDAKLLAVREAVEKKQDEGLSFAGVWGQDPEGTQYGFEDEIQHCYFSGFQNKDVAFFHGASRTLVQADLLLNLPATEQYSKSGGTGHLSIVADFLNPYTWAHQKFLQGKTVDAAAMTRDAKTVAAWDFDRIIPCHGDVVENDGKKAWETAYSAFLQ